MVKTKQLKLRNAPTHAIEAALGKEKSTFELVEQDLPELQDGEVLYQTIFISNDPAQRGWMAAGQDPKRAYAPPVMEGDIMRAMTIGKIVKTKGDVGDLKEGSWVNATGGRDKAGWAENAVLKAEEVRAVPPPPNNAQYSIYLGPLGATGMTAYFGVNDILQLKKGESIVVNGAAGAVGNIVVQYAKHVIGASRVIAIAGSDDKCQWLKEIGADVALNYKDKDFYQQLEKATEDPPQCYFDNVGGEMTDFMLTRIAQFGRIAACGGISTYNGEAKVIKNWTSLTKMSIKWQGFIVLHYLDRAGEALQALGGAIARGQIKTDRETVKRVPFEEIPQVYNSLFVGANTGKLVTQIVDA